MIRCDAEASPMHVCSLNFAIGTVILGTRNRRPWHRPLDLRSLNCKGDPDGACNWECVWWPWFHHRPRAICAFRSKSRTCWDSRKHHCALARTVLGWGSGRLLTPPAPPTGPQAASRNLAATGMPGSRKSEWHFYIWPANFHPATSGDALVP